MQTHPLRLACHRVIGLAGLLLFASFFFFVPHAWAAVFDGPGLAGGLEAAAGISGVVVDDLPNFIQTVLSRILTFVNLAALVAIVVAGLYLILGFGSESAKDTAKRIIIYTCVGLLIINIAVLIVRIFSTAFAYDFSGDIRILMDRVLSYATLAALVVIVTAGFFLILGFGSDGAKERAKNMIIYTAAGLLVIAFANLIVTFFSTVGTADVDIRTPVVIVLNTVVNYLALAAVVVVVTAGVFLIVGMGSDTSKERAKNMIVHTLYGLLVVLFARLIVMFVLSIAEYI